MKLAIAIPTYNESKNLPKLVKHIKEAVESIDGLTASVLVLDDNSPDGTGEIANKLARSEKTKNFTVKVKHRPKKEGLGKAYVSGFKDLLKTDVDYILQMDADLSHDPKYLVNFIEEVRKGRDFVVASRYIPGGATPDWSLFRKIQSRGGNFYARVFLGSKVTDYTGGYNLYSKGLLKKIDLDSLQAGGYGFLIELKYQALKKCSSVSQVPIIFMDRRHGSSKIPRNTLLANLLLVPSLRFRHKT